MVVKTTKTPRKTTTKKATAKKPEHKTVDVPTPEITPLVSEKIEVTTTVTVPIEPTQPIIDSISKADIVLENTIKKVEEDIKPIVSVIEPISEKEVKQVEQLSYTTVPYIIRLIKKLKFW